MKSEDSSALLYHSCGHNTKTTHISRWLRAGRLSQVPVHCWARTDAPERKGDRGEIRNVEDCHKTEKGIGNFNSTQRLDTPGFINPGVGLEPGIRKLGGVQRENAQDITSFPSCTHRLKSPSVLGTSHGSRPLRGS